MGKFSGTDHILIVLSFIYIFIYIVIIQLNKNDFKHTFYEYDDLEFENRNENSTPRSFILPATPAIAIKQENSNMQSLSVQKQCLYKLNVLGYDVGSEDIVGNAKFITAIFYFQMDNELETTGKLNKITKRSLGCMNNEEDNSNS